jgi:hypothetical protein
VNTWATVFLGIIAMATLVTAILQVALLIAAAQLVRRVRRLIEDIDRDVRPILGAVSRAANDVARVTSMAAAQVERADQLLNSAAARVEDLLSHLQTVVVNTLREGNALVMGIRAVMAAFRAAQGRRRRRTEDDEALFI